MVTLGFSNFNYGGFAAPGHTLFFLSPFPNPAPCIVVNPKEIAAQFRLQERGLLMPDLADDSHLTLKLANCELTYL